MRSQNTATRLRSTPVSSSLNKLFSHSVLLACSDSRPVRPSASWRTHMPSSGVLDFCFSLFQVESGQIPSVSFQSFSPAEWSHGNARVFRLNPPYVDCTGFAGTTVLLLC